MGHEPRSLGGKEHAERYCDAARFNAFLPLTTFEGAIIRDVTHSAGAQIAILHVRPERFS